MSQALRKLAGVINKTNTTIIFINQLREKIGVMFGNPETTTGGRALKFFSSMRIDVRRVDSIKAGDQVLGNRTKAKIVKNKVAPPFKQAEFDIMYGKGISKSGDILDCAVDAGLVEKAGSWYSYQGNRIGQGRENVKLYLESNPHVMDELQGQLLDMLKASRKGDEEDAAEADVPGVSGGTSGPDGLLVDEDGVIIE
jgi:recombination protein RecA